MNRDVLVIQTLFKFADRSMLLVSDGFLITCGGSELDWPWHDEHEYVPLRSPGNVCRSVLLGFWQTLPVRSEVGSIPTQGMTCVVLFSSIRSNAVLSRAIDQTTRTCRSILPRSKNRSNTLSSKLVFLPISTYLSHFLSLSCPLPSPTVTLTL